MPSKQCCHQIIELLGEKNVISSGFWLQDQVLESWRTRLQLVFKWNFFPCSFSWNPMCLIRLNFRLNSPKGDFGTSMSCPFLSWLFSLANWLTDTSMGHFKTKVHRILHGVKFYSFDDGPLDVPFVPERNLWLSSESILWSHIHELPNSVRWWPKASVFGSQSLREFILHANRLLDILLLFSLTHIQYHFVHLNGNYFFEMITGSSRPAFFSLTFFSHP